MGHTSSSFVMLARLLMFVTASRAQHHAFSPYSSRQNWLLITLSSVHRHSASSSRKVQLLNYGHKLPRTLAILICTCNLPPLYTGLISFTQMAGGVFLKLKRLTGVPCMAQNLARPHAIVYATTIAMINDIMHLVCIQGGDQISFTQGWHGLVHKPRGIADGIRAH